MVACYNLIPTLTEENSVVTNHPSQCVLAPLLRLFLSDSLFLSSDPDIEYLPLFAVTTKFFSGLYSSFYDRVFEFDAASRILISIQHKLFYIILALARVNLYRLSYAHLLKAASDTKRFRGGRWAFWSEIAGILIFWYWFGWVVLKGCGSWQKALGYFLISHVTTGPLHVQVLPPPVCSLSRRTEVETLPTVYIARALPFFNVDRRPGSGRVLPGSSVAYNDGCDML